MLDGYFTDEKDVLALNRELGFLDKIDFPTFGEFVLDWFPGDIGIALMDKFGNGKITAHTISIVKVIYSVLIYQKAGSPSYYITPELVNALRDTKIPDFKVSSLKLPFEGIKIEVPRGTFESPYSGMQYIYLNCVSNEFNIVCPGDDRCALYGSLLEPADKTIFDIFKEAAGGSIIKDDETRFLYKTTKESSCIDDKFYNSGVFRLAINAALYITCREADMYKERSLEQQVIFKQLQGLKKKHKREKLEREYKKAKDSKRYIVGAAFKMDKEYSANLTESGKNWVLKHRCRVAGHWRQQPYGRKRELTKTIFIKLFPNNI